jgi:hypothetical protein
LTIRESFSAIGGVIQEGIALEANIDLSGTSIGDRNIGVSNLNIGFEPTIPGGERAVPNFEIFNLERFSLFPFQFLPALVGQGSEFIGSNSFFNTAPGLVQGED